MKTKEGLIDAHLEGELSSRLHALHELNMREHEAFDRKATAYVLAGVGLGLLMIAAAVASSWFANSGEVRNRASEISIICNEKCAISDTCKHRLRITTAAARFYDSLAGIHFTAYRVPSTRCEATASAAQARCLRFAVGSERENSGTQFQNRKFVGRFFSAGRSA
jgi:hypothetical protein